MMMEHHSNRKTAANHNSAIIAHRLAYHMQETSEEIIYSKNNFCQLDLNNYGNDKNENLCIKNFNYVHSKPDNYLFNQKSNIIFENDADSSSNGRAASHFNQPARSKYKINNSHSSNLARNSSYQKVNRLQKINKHKIQTEISISDEISGSFRKLSESSSERSNIRKQSNKNISSSYGFEDISESTVSQVCSQGTSIRKNSTEKIFDEKSKLNSNATSLFENNNDQTNKLNFAQPKKLSKTCKSCLHCCLHTLVCLTILTLIVFFVYEVNDLMLEMEKNHTFDKLHFVRLNFWEDIELIFLLLVWTCVVGCIAMCVKKFKKRRSKRSKKKKIDDDANGDMATTKSTAFFEISKEINK